MSEYTPPPYTAPKIKADKYTFSDAAIAAALEAGLAVVYMTPDAARARAAHSRFKESLGTLIAQMNDRRIEFTNGAWIQFVPCVLSGASCEHSSMLVVEDAAEVRDQQALYEAMFIPTKYRDVEPQILFIGNVLRYGKPE